MKFYMWVCQMIVKRQLKKIYTTNIYFLIRLFCNQNYLSKLVLKRVTDMFSRRIIEYRNLTWLSRQEISNKDNINIFCNEAYDRNQRNQGIYTWVILLSIFDLWIDKNFLLCRSNISDQRKRTSLDYLTRKFKNNIFFLFKKMYIKHFTTNKENPKSLNNIDVIL